MDVAEDEIDWDKSAEEIPEPKGKLAVKEDEDYIIPSSLILEIREQFLEKKQTFSRPSSSKRKIEDTAVDEDELIIDPGEVTTYTPGAKPSFTTTSLMHTISAAQRENLKRKKALDLLCEEERIREKEKENPTLTSRLPLAACGLSTATKKRCSDLCLRLIQQYSDVKNKADAEAISRVTAHGTETTDPLAVTASASTPEGLSDSNLQIDASLPQAACQLLIHVTRDSEVRDHFEAMGGVRQLLTTIPPFDGAYVTLLALLTIDAKYCYVCMYVLKHSMHYFSTYEMHQNTLRICHVIFK